MPSPKVEIPDHTLYHRIGKGGYGEIWLAENIAGVRRAVKVVWRDLFENDRPFEREFEGIQRYEPVSRQFAGLVSILHIGRDDELRCLYYIMELADAQNPAEDDYQAHTLKSEIQACGSLSLDACLEVALSLTHGLVGLHQHELIHRDIKPSNIVYLDGRAHLADPGLVATREQEQSLVGTEGFLAPEGVGTVAADVYSLGKALYEASSGLDRHEFPTLPEKWRQHSQCARYLEWNEILVRACEQDPAARYPSMTALLEDLQHLQAGGSVRKKRRGERHRLWLGRFVVFALLAGGLLVALTHWHAAKSEVVRVEKQRNDLERDRLLDKVGEAMERGDFGGALVSQASALRYEPDSEADAQRQRLRMGTLLQATPFLQHLSARDSPIVSAAFTSDGKRHFTAWRDGVVEIRNAVTHELIGAPLRLDGGIVDAALSGNGKRLLLLNAKGLARVWDTETVQPVTPSTLRHQQVLDVGALTDSGSTVALAGSARGITLWSLQGDEPAILREVPVGSRIRALSFPDERTIAAACVDGTLRFYEVATGRLKDQLVHAGGEVNSMDWIPETSLVVTGSYDRELRVWDREASAVTQKFGYPSRNFQMASAGPHGRFLLGKGFELGFCVWRLDNAAPWIVPDYWNDKATASAFSPDGRMVAVGGELGVVRFWDMATTLELEPRLRHAGRLVSLQFAPNARQFLTADTSGVCRVWEMDSSSIIDHEYAHGDAVVVTRFSHDGSLVLTASEDHTARLWEVASGAARSEPLAHEHRVVVGEFHPGGDVVLTASLDGKLKMWRVTDGVLLAEASHGQRLYDACFSDGGTQIASCGAEGSVHLWTWNGAVLEKSADLSQEGEIVSVSFQSNGHHLAANCWDKATTTVWDLGETPPRAVVALRTAAQNASMVELEDVVFLNEAEPLVAVAGWGGRVNVWRALSEENFMTLEQSQSIVTSLNEHRPSQQLLTTNSNGEVVIYDTGEWEASGQTHVFQGEVHDARLSSSGDWYAAAAADGIQLRQVSDGRALTPFLRRSGLMRALDLSERGEEVRIVAGGNDRLATLVRLRPMDFGESLLAHVECVNDPSAERSVTADSLSSRFQRGGNFRERWRQQWRLSDQAWHRWQAAAAQREGRWRAALFHWQRTNQDADSSKGLQLAQEAESQWEAGGKPYPQHYPSIPSRSSQASAGQLDLTEHYNAALDRSWQGTQPIDRASFRNDLAELSPGLHVMAGQTFDVRGVVQLGGIMASKQGHRFPERVKDLPVNQAFAKLHALHAIAYDDETPSLHQTVLTYRVHYEDGQVVDVPIFKNQHIREWWQGAVPVDLPEARVGWIGSTPRASLLNYPHVVLDVFTWENPHPNKVVSTIDLVSGMRNEAPFVVGLTVE